MATMLLIIQTTPRAERGTGALTIAVEGHWNSSMAGKAGSLASGECHTGTRLRDDALAPAIMGFARPTSSETASLPLAKASFAHALIS